MTPNFSFRRTAAILFALRTVSALAATQEPATATAAAGDCLSCHATNISAHAYAGSVHRSLSCVACHVKDDTKPVETATPGRTTCVVPFKATDCRSCHGAIVEQHALSVHNTDRLPVACSKCHSDIHEITSHKDDKTAAARLCSQCHEHQADYFDSSHFKALAAGGHDSATCTDCHGLHAIAKVDNVAQGRVFHTEACLKCHADTERMARNHVTAIAPQTFFESYHGKNVRLGYPERVAGCADCHNAHKVLPASDAGSNVHPANVVGTCAQCHQQASASFAKFAPHAEPSDRAKFPVLFWTAAGMTALMVGTFLFFWVHSLLWAFRAFVDKKRRRVAEFFPSAARRAPVETSSGDAEPPAGRKVYRRFRPVHIVLHLFVVVSFLGLALTGLPLKFSATGWGKALVDLIGGTARAGLIHRLCAIITFGYLLAACVMSVRFLFFDKRQKGGFVQRLFGPESLCPNFRDLRDLKAMFRWFFFCGRKPAFDRWAYWEKFDFFAVFWGVAVIGSSGLLLWFPEFFGRFLPGWIFNVATIVHSDEALLATGFIFTIHFFNTHFRPEKFPMDFVIFNGEVTEEEMVHERADQWKRYQELGIAHEFEVTKPSPLAWDLALRLFGLLAVLTGVVLALLMFYTFIGHPGH
ncbi:MAG TPA: hypothetical protein VK178_02695 [Opitutaceae bacterium]|nr:hypothetical protein [Opitutaceae bacterium]